jgi:hypothetical protein
MAGESPDGAADTIKFAGVVVLVGVTDNQLPVLLAVAVMGTEIDWGFPATTCCICACGMPAALAR